MVDSQHRKKFDAKSERRVFIGYCDKSKAYKVINLVTKRIEVSRDIEFVENEGWDWSNASESATQNFTPTVDVEKVIETDHENKSQPLMAPDERRRSNQHPNNSSLVNQISLIEEDATPVRYRELTDIYNMCSFSLTATDSISFEEVAKSKDWIMALREEMEAIHKNQK